MLSLDLLRAAKKNVPLKWGVGVCGVRGRRLIFVFFWGGRGRPVTPYLLYKYSQSLFLAHLNNEPEIDTVNIYIEDRGATGRPPSTFKKKKSSASDHKFHTVPAPYFQGKFFLAACIRSEESLSVTGTKQKNL